MIILIFLVVHWYLSLFAQSFLQHRYAAHGAFSMSKFWERVFYMFAYITQGSSYISPNTYAIMHRMHHAYADTDKDPHSPKFAKNVFLMMWHTRVISANIYKRKVHVENRFTKNLPDWRHLDKWAHSVTSRLMWVMLYIVFYCFFATSPWMFLLIFIHILMVPIQGAIINWFAHKYGSIRFALKNTSRNLLPVDIFMMGESYHNNHHKNPSSINFGLKWHELDPTYPVILLLNWLHVIKVRKSESPEVRMTERTVPDLRDVSGLMN